MKISKSDAVRIFVEVLGIAAAKGWDDKQLNKKLQVLGDDGVVTKDDLKKAKDKKLVDLTKKVLVALENEDTVEVVADAAPAKGKAKDEKPAKGGKKAAAQDESDDDEEGDEDSDEDGDEEESEGDDEDGDDSDEESESDDEDEDSDDEEEEEEKPVKKGKKVAEKPAKAAAKKGKKDDDDEDEKPAKKPAKKTSSVERDEWGVKLGTRTARINAAISDKPRTMAEIQQLAKATGISSHMSKLKELKLIKKTEEGYVRTKEGMKGYDPARAKKTLKG